MWITFDKLPDFPAGQYPHGVCPFASGRPLMIPTNAGPIATPGQQAVTMGVSVIPCFGAKCQLWEKLDNGSGYCTIARAGVELSALVSHLERQAEPPKGETPAQSIAADVKLIAEKIDKGVKVFSVKSHF